MNEDDIEQAIQAMHDSQRAAFLLSIKLKGAGDNAGATNAQNRADRLQNEIDNAVNKELDEWEVSAKAVIPQLTRLLRKLKVRLTKRSRMSLMPRSLRRDESSL